MFIWQLWNFLKHFHWNDYTIFPSQHSHWNLKSRRQEEETFFSFSSLNFALDTQNSYLIKKRARKMRQKNVNIREAKKINIKIEGNKWRTPQRIMRNFPFFSLSIWKEMKISLIFRLMKYLFISRKRNSLC